MKIGILYFVWGDKHESFLQRSIASVHKHHPDMLVHIERRDSGQLIDKAKMYDLSPFDVTLYLDVDTVVMGDLSFGFRKAETHGIAACICECPWARRYGGLKHVGDVREFNTGVLFFDKRLSTSTFKRWPKIAADLDSSIEFYVGDEVRTMPSNDQASFAMAVEDSGFNPFVLPMNWNLRPTWHKSWFGPVRIWHDYEEPPASLTRWNVDQSNPESIIRYMEVR